MKTQPSQGVLLLSHRGFSFLEDLATQVRALDLEVYILSSTPALSHSERREAIAALATWSHVLPARATLQAADVDAALQELESSGHRVIAAISVWDGYRGLMAHSNRRLGAEDLAIETVNLLNDKLSLRHALNHAGLSAVVAQCASPELLTELRGKIGRRFIKPRRGLASFAAFELKDELQWQELEALRQGMEADEEYGELLAEHRDFIVEDFIEGQEISFEVIVAQGSAYVIGAHEKVHLVAAQRTMLEAACVAPPPSLDPKSLRRGIAFVRRVCAALGITTGCFHLECRVNGTGHWEVIEINSRLGGAFINQSVKALSGGSCLLQLWLAGLVGRPQPLRRLEIQTLARPWSTTVFRVFFGAAGREITRIESGEFAPKPAEVRMMVKVGDTLPQGEREIFVAQMLWTLADAPNSPAVTGLVERSPHALELSYAA
jgi:biotin carboxylase